MIKRFLFLFLLITCLIFTLISCKGKEENTPVTSFSSTQGTMKDNQNPTPPPVVDNNKCEHIFSSVTVDKNTDSNYAVLLKSKCSICYKEITKEALCSVEAEEWRNALSLDGMKSFTLVNGVTSTDYCENIARRYKTVNDVYTEEYFIRNAKENSIYYVNENLLGYKIMYSDFEYNPEKRAYVYKLNDTSFVEIMFFDKKLLSISTVSLENEQEHKSTFYYLNQNLVSVSVPDYFFERYENMVSVEALKNAKVSSSDAEKINSLLTSISFEEIRYDISYSEHGGMGICFYFEESQVDPIFGDAYNEISISAEHDVMKELKIGNNTYVFE